MGDQIAILEPDKIEEVLADRVDLDIARKGFDCGKDAPLYVTVERVVRRAHRNPMRLHFVLRMVDSTLTLDVIEWGVPPPAKGSRRVTNVRNLSSPFSRPMLSNHDQRCLVPWTQFCEWTGEQGSKRKVWFERTDAPVSAFADLWRETSDGPRMAFLTTQADETVGAARSIPRPCRCCWKPTRMISG